MITYLLITVLLISFSMFFESFGFILRLIGKYIGSPSLGYSYHVQLATLTRFGTLVSFPLIAFMIDSGISTDKLLVLPVLIYFFLLVLLLIFWYNSYISYYIGIKVFKLLSFISGAKNDDYASISIDKLNNRVNECDNNSLEFSRIIKFGTLAFLLTSTSFLLSSIIASYTPGFRATILQSSPFLSSTGTLFSVLFFDPSISKLIDKTNHSHEILNAIWKSRIYGSFIALSFFILLNLIFHLYVK